MARWKGPVLFVLALVVLVLTPRFAFAQGGNIAGTVRDSQGGVLPGVTVEVASPQLIEKVRSTVTNENGRYQIVALPVGVYTVTFKLANFSTVTREKLELSSDFTAPVNVELKIGTATEIVTVEGNASGQVDVVNARQRQVFSREELIDLPTTRNLNSLINLVPGISVSTAGFSGNSVPTICSGGMADGATGAFNTSGGLSGCTPIIQGFNAHSSMNDPDSLNQGRMQVDGLGVQSFGGGGRSNYIADISNAQEVTFTLSGSLGESETGGTTINVVPRTGGNRYSGSFFTAFSNGHFFGKNNGTRTSSFSNRLDREYDANASFGGPIIRDRLWFYGAARRQDRDSWLQTAYRNANEGVFGANYRRNDVRVMQDDMYQNASMRLTLQATQRDKFNLFWDEQYTCENPCHGTSGSPTSVEAQGSPVSHPLHLAQLSWTNPLTSKILLEGGISHYGSHRNETQNISELAYPSLPRVVESGINVDIVNATALSTVTSGSINNAINWNIDNIQSRASASYVTGSHNIKLGYQGQYLSRVSNPYFNDMRLQYGYSTPGSTCSPTAPALGGVNTGNNWCGLLPDGSANTNRTPVPNTVTEYIPNGSDEVAWFSAFYLQDQWTWNRFTFSGAVRYDNAQSKFGTTCVGPDVHTTYKYCLNDPASGDDGRGVYFQDFTPRWGVTWDVFGNGKTALKYSMGKYLDGAQAGGIYTASNPASGGRNVTTYTRLWRDIDGDRMVDCDLSVPAVAPSTVSFPNSGECGPISDPNSQNNARRFGRSPDDLDDAGQAIGLGTLYCGQYERSMSPAIANYCNNYFAAGGSSLLDGWGKRRYEWQLSIGIQHEVLPRLSAEVTYNRRHSGNQTISDLIGSGCDLYSSVEGGTIDAPQCMQNLLNFSSPTYDFYSVQAPLDPRLPGGGGYTVPGFATLKQTGCSATDPGTGACTNAAFLTAPASQNVRAVTLVPEGAQTDFWSGIDTNFVLRARGGLRVSGGTSTGRRVNDTCGLLVDDPPTGQTLREGRERLCDAVRPFQTNVRGTASYTIPWVDVLASAVFTYRPGVSVNANYTVGLDDIGFQAGAVRYTSQLSSTSTATSTVTQNLISNDTFGEGIRIVDFKLAKNIRFAGKRLNVGADVYNVFNSDAALGYCANFPNPSENITGCTTASGSIIPWRSVNNITTPRFVRFQLQFDF